MARPDTDSEFNNFSRYKKPTVNRLGDSELIALDRELQKYMVTKEINYPTKDTITVLDEKSFLIDRKVLSKDGGIKITEWTPSKWNDSGTRLLEIYDMAPIPYEQTKEDLAQWKRWKNKDKTKELMHFDQMSKQMGTAKKITNSEMEF